MAQFCLVCSTEANKGRYIWINSLSDCSGNLYLSASPTAGPVDCAKEVYCTALFRTTQGMSRPETKAGSVRFSSDYTERLS